MLQYHHDIASAKFPEGAGKRAAASRVGVPACPLKPPQPGFAKNGGGQNARATGGPGILPET